MHEYNKRLVEVDEILNHLSEEDLLKIPEDVRKAIKDNKDKDYVWKYDETKSLKNQDLSRDTIVLLSYLNMEYLLDEGQKNLMKQIHEFNERTAEEEKKNKYNTEDLFKHELKSKKTDLPEKETSLIERKEKTWFNLFINKIKSIFRK